METTKTHSSRLGLTLLLALIGLTAFMASAQADHLYDPRQKCEEISQYFNPDLPILKDTDPPLTGIQQNCENLDHHLPFPGAHKPDIKLSEHKEAVKTSNQPWSQHMHRYYNDSQEDLNQTITQNGKQIKVNFYYLSAIDTFEFHLEDDFIENILLDTVQCAGLPKGNNCSGTGTLGKNENGDNMGFNVSFDKQKGIIKWNFPGKVNGWAKPNTYGENPTLDKLTGNPDTTNEKNRMLELGINFKTKDVQEDVWSATVTSKALIKDFVAKMPKGQIPKLSDWQAIEKDVDQPGEFENYYWFPIGTTTTIWERAPLPENVCKNLTAKLDKNPIEILGKKAYKIDTNITFEPENILPSEAKILWESSDKNGEFWTPSPKGAIPYSKLGTGKAETTLKQTVYYGGKGTLTIQLAGIDKKLANPDKCKILVAIPSEDIRCEKLLVDHPEVVYTDTYSAFRSKALDNNSNTFSSKISYTVDKGHGEFYLSKPASVPKNPSAEILETIPALVIFGGPYLDFSGIKIDNGNSNFGGIATNLVLDLAKGDFNNKAVNSPDKNLDFTSSPKFYGTNSLIALSVDANPGKGSVNTEIDYKTPINTGKLNQDDLTLKDPIITKTIDLPKNPSNPLLESVTVPQDTYVYFIGKQAGKNTIHVDATESSDPTCERDFDIERLPAAPICQKLNFITNTKGNLVAGQPSMINIDPTDSKGGKLPKTTKFTLTTTTDGKFKTLSGKDLGNTALLSDFPIQLVGATKAGTVKVEIAKDDPLYSGFCASAVTVEKTAEPLVCTSLKHQIKVLGTGTISNSLEKNMAYEIASEASYSKTYTNTITYTIDPAYGAFVKVANTQALAAFITGIKTLQLTDKLDATTLTTFVGSSLVANTITADQNKTVYLFTYSTAPASKTDTLKIQATGFDNADCNKIVPFTVPGVTPPQGLKCESLAITSLDGTAFDPSKSSTFKLTGEYKNHDNGIEVSVSGKGTVSKNVEESYSPKITFAQTEVNSSTNNLFFQYKKDDAYSLQTDTVSISAKAVNAPAGVCESSVSKQATPSTPGGGSPGGGSPGGGGGIPPKESPTIQKFVFKTNKLKDADDELNISKDTPYITYMIVFTAGEDSKSVEIQDTELKNSGTIQSKNTKTVLNGTLDYNGMIINVVDKKADKKYTILKTTNYSPDSTNSDISDKNFTDSDKKEDKYKCEKDTKTLCIETNSFEDTVKSFKKGDEIKFKNIQTLGETGKIVIKYQMKNNTAIDEKTCLQLKANKDGCGEEFENEAKFISYDDSNFKNEIHKKSDGTKVIAVCPFILTREGGDVFFHDVLDTGVDVEECGVKSSTGPGITPEPEKPQEHAPTGTSSEKTPVLSQPTHSICQLSNSKDNVEGYNDVLENFSSSICELKAEVAQAWKEKNINKSIAANVERLARWQENLTIDKITSMSDLGTITNRKNGVFVKKDGNLEIGSTGTEFTIESTDSGIPAAQTYIIQNGDLVINSNIKYANASLTLGGLVNPRKIPSAAFIVIDGNIIIDDSVTQIDGILMAVDLDGERNDGKVKQREKTTNFLKINGSLIGDVYELFSNRTGAGDPKKDEGSVTIHYDSRILLNTPPGISELVDVKQAVVPN